jgi:3-oxoacyl-[acyl-carrier protein] reductase
MTEMTMPRARDLEGKVALVVGGSRNMGAAIAEEIASRGATTVFSFREHGDEAARTLTRIKGHGVVAEAIRSDATVPDSSAKLFEDVVERHGRLDIVVHMPGMVLKKPLAEVTDEEFETTMDLNARSGFLTLRGTARHIGDGGRCVILSSSLTALTTPLYGVYAAGKGVVEQLVKAAAQELGARGITVNAVAPGAIDDSFFHGAETPESVEWSTHANPRHRLGMPSDVAPVVGFLVSDVATWVTGQVVRINGGMV